MNLATPPDQSTILVVDYCTETRTFVHRVLHQGGYYVILATSKREATDYISRNTPDLIINTSGFSALADTVFLRYLQADPLTRNIPLLPIVAHRELPGYKASTEYSIRSKIGNPIDADELLSLVASKIIATQALPSKALLHQDVLRDQCLSAAPAADRRWPPLDPTSAATTVETGTTRNLWRSISLFQTRALAARVMRKTLPKHLHRLKSRHRLCSSSTPSSRPSLPLPYYDIYEQTPSRGLFLSSSQEVRRMW